MQSRTESQTAIKSNRKRKIQSIILRLINLIFKTYATIGTIYLTALIIVTVIYKIYLHSEPPFDYQMYLSDNQLVVLLTVIISSLVFSGLIALLTSQRKRVRKQAKKAEEKPVSNRMHGRKRRQRVA